MREATTGGKEWKRKGKPNKKGYNGSCGAPTVVIALKNKNKKKC